MSISATEVKELRECTGAGMMDCKKALTESNGNVEKAIEILREKGLAAAAKKSGRIATEGVVESYIHMGGKIGVLVQVKSENANAEVQRVARDVAMHVAATNPAFLNKELVDATTLEKEKEIFRVQAQNEGKPENIVEKMVMGRINKYYKEAVLLEQPFVKDPDLSVAKYVEAEGKKLGAIEVVQYVRFEKGEGIEKKEEDFAAEVAAQVSKGN